MIPALKRTLRAPSYAQTELIHTIRRCGLTSGLKLCLDAGDAASYSSGQSWLDRSGNGFDFFLGATGSSEASDPTFNGTAGQRTSSVYWSFDGGDYFRYDTTNETWMNNLHKDNAKFTLIAGVQIATLGALIGISGTGSIEGSTTGVTWFTRDTDDRLSLRVRNGASLALSDLTGPVVTAAVPQFVAVSIDEAVGANGGVHYLNGSVVSFTSTYSSPSTGSAGNTMEIGSASGAGNILPSASRLWFFAAWEGVALTLGQLHALYQCTRGRFGA